MKIHSTLPVGVDEEVLRKDQESGDLVFSVPILEAESSGLAQHCIKALNIEYNVKTCGLKFKSCVEI